jgi:hypothetical protein
MPVPLEEALSFDEPALVLPWESTRFDALLTSLGRGPVILDPARGGTSVFRAARFLGLPFRATLSFDPNGVMTGATLTPLEDPESPSPPDSLAEQSRTLGPFILRRRAALADLLGPGEKSGECRMVGLPCDPMQWTTGKVVLVHEVSWNVERGGDEYGYLADRIEIRRG